MRDTSFSHYKHERVPLFAFYFCFFKYISIARLIASDTGIPTLFFRERSWESNRLSTHTAIFSLSFVRVDCSGTPK